MSAKEFEVIYPWRDLEDTGKTFPEGREYEVGDDYPATKRNVPPERIEELLGSGNKIGRPLIAEKNVKKEVDETGDE